MSVELVRRQRDSELILVTSYYKSSFRRKNIVQLYSLKTFVQLVYV